jgi:hypothetical protein
MPNHGRKPHIALAVFAALDAGCLRSRNRSGVSLRVSKEQKALDSLALGTLNRSRGSRLGVRIEATACRTTGFESLITLLLHY